MLLWENDLQILWPTLKLATTVTLLLLFIGTPIAWWLAHTSSWWKRPINAVVALPLVLPPSVLGFYLLLAMGPDGPIGKLTNFLGISSLPFTFAGLVVASVFYSLPFMVQPLLNAFELMGRRPLEVAATLRASHLDAFFSVAIPSALPQRPNCVAHCIGASGSSFLRMCASVAGSSSGAAADCFGVASLE